MTEREILSSEEVDALVRGVDSGEVETATGSASHSDAQPFDFATQSQLLRGRMPTLERINERFGQLFRKSLFNLLRRSIEVSVSPMELKKFADYANALVSPTSLNLVRISGLRGSSLIVIDPKLVFCIVDNFFGGRGRMVKLDGREFTATERRIITVILKLVFQDLREAWTNIAPFEVEYLSSESNPHFAHIVGSTEIVTVSKFHVALDNGVGGDVHLTIPYSCLEPMKRLLESGLQPEQGERDERFASLLRSELQDADVSISACLGRAQISLADLINLKPGDIVPCDFAGKATVSAEDIPIFRGSFGVSRGQHSVKYETLLSRPRHAGSHHSNHS